MLAVVLLFVGCVTDREEPWLTVGDSDVFRDEVMLYLYQTYNEFEDYGGEDVWFTEDFSGGKSAGEVAKQGALDNLIMAKVLATKASALGIETSVEVKNLLTEEAGTYYNALPDLFVVSNGIEEDTVLTIFMESHLSNEVRKETMSNYVIDPEDIMAKIEEHEEYSRISSIPIRDIFTTYKFQHLVVRTQKQDSNGQWQPLTEEEYTRARERIDGILLDLRSGKSVETVVEEQPDLIFNKDQKEGVTLNKAQLPTEYRDVLDSMIPGEMTEVIEGALGLHIFVLYDKKVPTEEELIGHTRRFHEWVERLKKEAESILMQEAFDNIYMDWKDSVTISYSQQWQDLVFTELLPEFKGKTND